MEAPKPGDSCCVWYGSGFTRRGVVVAVNVQDEMVLVRFPEYSLPDDWCRFNQLC